MKAARKTLYGPLGLDSGSVFLLGLREISTVACMSSQAGSVAERGGFGLLPGAGLDVLDINVARACGNEKELQPQVMQKLQQLFDYHAGR